MNGHVIQRLFKVILAKMPETVDFIGILALFKMDLKEKTINATVQGDYPVQVRILHFSANLYAGARMGMWCFDNHQKLLNSTCPNEQELFAFLKLGDCFDFVFENEVDEKTGKIVPVSINPDSKVLGGWTKPVVMSDSLGLIWVAEHMYCTENAKRQKQALIIMGPMFLSQNSIQNIEKNLREKNLSVQVHRQMMRTLTEVPMVMLSTLNSYIQMLHYCLTGDEIRQTDFLFQNEQTIAELFQERRIATLEKDNPERVLQEERVLLGAVRDGNLNYRDIMRDMNYGGEFFTNTDSSLRDAKDMILVLNALCSREAIQGGLSVNSAKEIERRYMVEIEKCRTVSKLANINHKMLEEYVTKVHKIKENPLISKKIQESCDYIRANVKKPMTVEDIAASVGYSAYYFSRKFYRETGIKVTDYIKKARIEYAKVALLTTKQSIQEISDSLQFGTINYFSSVFREIVGMPPAAYRQQSDFC